MRAQERYEIPLFDLNYDREEQEAVREALASKWISMGPRCEEFERRFANLLGAKHAVSLSNCTAALHIANLVLGIGPGHEVITPSLTFVATVNAIRYTGATPVFCDIRSFEDLTLDAQALEGLVTQRTRAIMVMHFAGFPCDMERITALARRYGLRVIEDASHAPMSRHGNRKLGTWGDVGCFSFFSNKNISIGEGGMLVTDDEELYRKAKLLRSHGMTSLSYERSRGHATSYDVVALGYNYRLDDIRAALGIAQLGKLEKDLAARAAIRTRYLEGLEGTRNLLVPFRGHVGYVANYIFPVVLKDSTRERRDRVRKELAGKGIETSVHYPAVHRFSIYNTGLGLAKTEYVSENIITLPLHACLEERQVDHVVAALRTAIE